MDSRHKRLLEVLRTYDHSLGYDIEALSRLSLLTRKECIAALAGLIASGTIHTSR
jgi:hypothetical protein